MLSAILKRIIQKQDLGTEDARTLMTEIMSGRAGEIRTAAILAALSCKGETGEEIEAFTRSMRKAAVVWPGGNNIQLCDTCGTGGDSAGTLNISTLAAILLASMGFKVAKHGNRAVSSQSGSADLLEGLEIRLDLEPEQVVQCLDQVGICFLYAPRWHPAMKFAAPVRKTLKVRTVFNLLGPLTNPAPISHQVLGLFSDRFMEPVSEALCRLGRKGAYVVHAEDGLDEVSIAAPTHFVKIEEGKIVDRGALNPADFGFEKAPLETLKTRDRDEALERSLAILAGEGSEAENSVISMNAGLVYSLVHRETDLKKAAAACLENLKAGKGEKLIRDWKNFYC